MFIDCGGSLVGISQIDIESGKRHWDHPVKAFEGGKFLLLPTG
jgi:hypothetical protein